MTLMAVTNRCSGTPTAVGVKGRKGRRGYLGPLGDDFPAIFPIALGLMFFFSAITLTYDYYNVKRDSALLIEANVALAKAARSQLLFSEDHWNGVCDLVDKTKANYGVRAKVELLDFDPDGFEFDEMGYDNNPCVDVEDGDGKPLPLEGDFFMALTYPVLAPDGVGNKVATLRVTTWM